MLTFITGADAAAKRDYIANALLSQTRAGKKAALLVPEQASFERDRALLFAFGAQERNRMRVTSFARFAEELLEENNVALKPRADAAATAVLMSLALRETAPELSVYARHYRRPASVKSLLGAYDAMRQAGLSVETLQRLSARVSGSLKQKTKELALIFAAYEALVTPRFSNAADNIHRAALLLEHRQLYRDTVFYVDDVRSFSGVQRRLLTALLRQTDVYISLPGDNAAGSGMQFPHAAKQKARLTADAKSVGARVFRTEVPAGETGGLIPFLRTNLFSDAAETWEGDTDALTVTRCETRYEECEFIAGEIKALLESGACRAREITVLFRDPQYMPALTSALKGCGLPVFEDKRRALYQYPPARLLLHAAAVAAKGFSTEELLSLLKTEIAGVSAADVGLLENYVFRWQIDGRRWEREFTEHPGGFGLTMDDAAKETLCALNSLREEIVLPLQKLRGVFAKRDAKENCRGLYLYLKELKADAHFLDYAACLYAHGNETEALACDRAWEQCMQALDALAAAVGEHPVEPVYFYELLTLLFSGTALGEIPTGVDQVTLGTLDHTRTLEQKAVFVAGLNEGVFPAASASGGIFTAKETRVLTALEASFGQLPEEQFEEEQLIAYEAFTGPARRLYLTYAAAANGGEKLSPSPFLDDLLRLVPGLKPQNAAALPPEKKIVSPTSAFAVYAGMLRENTVFGGSLRQALEEDRTTAGKLAALDRTVAGVEADFSDPKEALRLFGKDLYFSASKAETYAKCPFLYFCRYGMGAEAVAASRLDVRVNGLVVHHVLDVLLAAHRETGVGGLPEAQLRAEISAAVADYVRDYMGGEENLPAYILRSLQKTENVIFEILLRMQNELDTCSFVTVDTELKIGGKDAQIPAYTLSLPDGGTLRFGGSVDRVDLMRTPEQNYVRVIDYKTGGKDFKLGDVFAGLNMQMLLYLFAICENGEAYYGPLLPAGVLYVPANTGGKTLGRRDAPDAVERQKLKNGRMNGVILENETVVKGMESAARGIYINAEIKADGSMKGTFLTLEEFRLLHKKTDALLRETGMQLHRGAVPALPVDDGGNRSVCDYCDYAAVCLKESDCAKRKIAGLSHEDARLLLREEETDG